MTKEIQKALGKRQVLRNHTPVICNITTVFDWEIDLLSVGKSGYTYEFEIKISRGDFLKDKKKSKWQLLTWKKKTPNYMSYVCPDGLIQLSEIPEYFGLYYYSNGEINEVREPKLRHSDLFDKSEINLKAARMYSQREFLGGITLISHINKGIKERNAEHDRKNREAQEKLMQMWRDKKLLIQGESVQASVATDDDSNSKAD